MSWSALSKPKQRLMRSHNLDWISEIAGPGGWQDEGPDRRFLGHAGLLIHRASGRVWCDSNPRITPVEALRLYQPDYSDADTVAWIEARLAAHPAPGSSDPDYAEDDETSHANSEYRAMRARDAIERSEPITPGTTVWRYLEEQRGIDPKSCDPDHFRFLRHAASGDDGFVTIAGSPQEPTSVQLTYVDAHGRKSARKTPRIRWVIQHGKPHAIALPGVPGPQNETIIVEGAEDGLSVAGIPSEQRPILILLGLGELSRLTVPGKNCTYIIVRDGDPPGGSAEKALRRGIDNMILQDATVRVTDTPLQEDANSILTAQGHDALAALIANATEKQLTDEGEVERIHRIADPYERERAIIEAKKTRKLSKGFVRDRLTHLERLDKAKVDDATATSSPSPSEPEPWPEPVNFGDLLDEIEALITKFIATDEPEIVVVVATSWAAHAHLLHHPQVHIGASPRLYVAGKKHNTGKSTLTDSIGLLMPRTMTGSDLTGPALFRSIEEGRHSLVIHQANTLFRRDGSTKSDGLASVLNSGHRRREAVIRRVVTASDGSQKPTAFSSWAPMVIDGIRFLPTEEMRSRCIELWMHPATEHEALGLLDLDLHEGLFTDLKRKLIRWANDLTELDLQPALPQRIYSRNALNWRILFAIAHVAGERWVAKVEHAAITILDRDSDDRDTIEERLLRSIHFAFEKQREIDRQPGHKAGTDNYGFLSTQTLIAYLLTDHREQWARANRSHPIDDYYLRDHLKMLVTRNTTRVDAGRDASGKRQRVSGYFRHQFQMAWFRYLNLIEQPISARIPARQFLPLTCRATAMLGVPDQPSHPANGTNGNGAAHPAKPRKPRTPTAPRRRPPTEQPQVTKGTVQ